MSRALLVRSLLWPQVAALYVRSKHVDLQLQLSQGWNVASFVGTFPVVATSCSLKCTISLESDTCQ